MRKNPIGVIDSGVGGISVLKELMKSLPSENFIYYGDSANAPYGSKDDEEILRLTKNVVIKLMKMDIKTLVIACNTSTSTAIEELRKEFPIPIIGIEPAVKQAIQMKTSGNIIVMATETTIRRDKYKDLVRRYDKNNQVISLPCKGLVDFIERGEIKGEKLLSYLHNLLKDYKDEKGILVLGCTHYPFIKGVLSKVMKNYDIIDGSFGVSKELTRVLKEKDLMAMGENRTIEIINSKEDKEIYNLCNKLLYDL